MSSIFLFLSLLVSISATNVEFSVPASKQVDHVNPLIGNGGGSPDGSGGMIPSTAPPFAMTRWVAQTRQNYVSMTPYNYTDSHIHGFQGTHQPAIWMGESGQVIIVPGTGGIKPLFKDRGMSFTHESEVIAPNYYRVNLTPPEGGKIVAEQTATSRVGHFRLRFEDTQTPYVLVEACRASVVGSADPANVTYPLGSIFIDPSAQEIVGSNSERQDFIIGPNPATSFRGYFCARFSQPFESWGTAINGTLNQGDSSAEDKLLSGFVTFSENTQVVEVRVGVSFISIEQARNNLDKEIPDGTSLEHTSFRTRHEWAEKLDRVKIEGATEEDATTFYTALFHTLQYPYEQSESGKYYSGYDDQVHDGISYTGYSVWDTYRAAWGWLILLAPERLPGMVTSMLQDYKEGGWLPMWKNIVETNIMVGTHADSQVAEAVIKGVGGFDLDLAYEAVYRDATVPPVNDQNTSYFDRQENVGYEVRAGLSSVYATKSWVASDIHSEAASRTLDYAYDDYAVSKLATALNKTDDASFFLKRAKLAPLSLFNTETGFMEAKFANGSWAGPEAGWTEGDKWAYTFDIVHDVDELIRVKGGKQQFVDFLDEHFNGGHNYHSNEPSHHIPYLYALAGASSKGAERIREIAQSEYNSTVNGLPGNEDCGQMSAWYIFSALGFYPVDPVSKEYVVGTPFFDKVTIDFPNASKPLVITAEGAATKPYVKSLKVNGRNIVDPLINYDDIADGGEFVFEMSDKGDESFASETLLKPRSARHQKWGEHTEL